MATSDGFQHDRPEAKLFSYVIEKPQFSSLRGTQVHIQRQTLNTHHKMVKSIESSQDHHKGHSGRRNDHPSLHIFIHDNSP